MQNFGNFDLLELFHFQSEPSQPEDYGRGRSLKYVCHIWEEQKEAKFEITTLPQIFAPNFPNLVG